jgi:hypothetical protein
MLTGFLRTTADEILLRDRNIKMRDSKASIEFLRSTTDK